MPDIASNGFRCHYDYRAHRAGAPTVVFCNGIMSMLESWDRQLPLLERLGYNALRFEYRGQWRSELTPGRYDFDLHCDDLAALMDALDIDRAHLVGTSYGGFVGMRFAARYPRRAQSLMVITSAARIGPLAYRIVSNWRELAASGDVAALYRAMVPDLHHEDFIAREGAQVDGRLQLMLEAARTVAPDFLAGQVALHETTFRELLGDGMLHRLGAIACPTLVLAGADDRVYPPACSAAIAHRIPGARYLVAPDSGHALVSERPELVNLLLAGMLAAA